MICSVFWKHWKRWHRIADDEERNWSKMEMDNLPITSAYQVEIHSEEEVDPQMMMVQDPCLATQHSVHEEYK